MARQIFWECCASRQIIIGSKLAIAVGFPLVVWLIEITVFYFASRGSHVQTSEEPIAYAGLGLALLGLSWLFSTFIEQERNVIAVTLVTYVAGFIFLNVTFGDVVAVEILEFLIGIGAINRPPS